MENTTEKQNTLKKQENRPKDTSNANLNTGNYFLQSEGKYKLTLRRMLDVGDKKPILKKWS